MKKIMFTRILNKVLTIGLLVLFCFSSAFYFTTINSNPIIAIKGLSKIQDVQTVITIDVCSKKIKSATEMEKLVSIGTTASIRRIIENESFILFTDIKYDSTYLFPPFRPPISA